MTSQQIHNAALPQTQQNFIAQVKPLLETAIASCLQVEVLDRCIGIVVPTTVDANVPTDTSLHVEQAKQIMAECFGGVSSWEQQGLYISNTWGIIREKSILVRSYATTEALHRHFGLLLCFVVHLGQELRQETIAIEIDGKMLLIAGYS